MAERTYGDNKVLYEVVEETGGIVLVVRHSNQKVRELLARHANTLSILLSRRGVYFSGARAKVWLGLVMDDYKRQFQSNRVKISFQ